MTLYEHGEQRAHTHNNICSLEDWEEEMESATIHIFYEIFKHQNQCAQTHTHVHQPPF